jgi:uncharacterized protein (TIGR00369 family)
MNYTQFMEIRVSAEHDDGVTIECPTKDFYFNPDGSLHGGLIATIADEAVWFALERHYRPARHSTTTELKVNYLRPALRTASISARARLIKPGKTLCVGTVELTDDRGALCAFATVTYMMLEEKDS